jgi:glycosyltransferase involved in cell wall biosynthesis
MDISICITVLNEETSVGILLDSLLSQTKRPDTIIIVDGGSTDGTIEIIRHFQKKDSRIKLLIEKCSRARGRNLAVEIAKTDIVAMTDAGCIPQKNWLENLVAPFGTGRVDVSAGFYKMTGSSSFQRAESIFLGVKPRSFNMSFLPSTRSIAFTKEIWERVGGFPENLEGAAEDTVFNYKLLSMGAKISRMKNAVVEWGMPESLNEFFWKIFTYAKGDAKSKIWFFPRNGPTSHNIKALSIVFRYLAGITLLILGLKYVALYPTVGILFLFYLIWAFRKAGVWGPVLQVVSDVGVMYGFLSGIFK